MRLNVLFNVCFWIFFFITNFASVPFPNGVCLYMLLNVYFGIFFFTTNSAIYTLWNGPRTACLKFLQEKMGAFLPCPRTMDFSLEPPVQFFKDILFLFYCFFLHFFVTIILLVRAVLCRQYLTVVGHYFCYIFTFIFFFSYLATVPKTT